MKPVFQTRFGEDGNCFEACIASILEISLEEVPDLKEFKDSEAWSKAVNSWLKTRGLQYIELDFHESDDMLWEYVDSYHLIIGKTGHDLFHSVVGHNGKVVFDPLPYYSFVHRAATFRRLGFLIFTGEKA